MTKKKKDKFLKLIIPSLLVMCLLIIATSLLFWMESDRKRLAERGQVVIYAEGSSSSSNWFHQGAFHFHRR